jgi:asparagine synthase (glutamine-hydrolysing)
MIAHGEDPRALYQLAYALFVPETQRRLLRGHEDALVDGLPPGMRQRLEELDADADDKSILARIARLEQTLFLGERLLRDTDAASMSASIEIRLPLVDQILVERVGRLPTAARFDPIGKKAALRRAGLRGLDAGLFERPKSGFVLPYDRWLRSGLGQAIDGTMRDTQAIGSTGLDPAAVAQLWDAYRTGASGLYWSRIWAIYAYVRWCHRHRVSL